MRTTLAPLDPRLEPLDPSMDARLDRSMSAPPSGEGAGKGRRTLLPPIDNRSVSEHPSGLLPLTGAGRQPATIGQSAVSAHGMVRPEPLKPLEPIKPPQKPRTNSQKLRRASLEALDALEALEASGKSRLPNTGRVGDSAHAIKADLALATKADSALATKADSALATKVDLAVAIKAIEALSARQSAIDALVTEHNALVTEHNALLTEHKALLTQLNEDMCSTNAEVEILGEHSNRVWALLIISQIPNVLGKTTVNSFFKPDIKKTGTDLAKEAAKKAAKKAVQTICGDIVMPFVETLFPVARPVLRALSCAAREATSVFSRLHENTVELTQVSFEEWLRGSTTDQDTLQNFFELIADKKRYTFQFSTTEFSTTSISLESLLAKAGFITKQSSSGSSDSESIEISKDTAQSIVLGVFHKYWKELEDLKCQKIEESCQVPGENFSRCALPLLRA